MFSNAYARRNAEARREAHAVCNRTEAWIAASYSTASPGYGTHAKKLALMAKPELKGSTILGAQNVHASRAFRCDVRAVVHEQARAARVWDYGRCVAKMRAQKSGEVVEERWPLEERSAGARHGDGAGGGRVGKETAETEAVAVLELSAPWVERG
ncbi:hypothetical protein BJV78DRAFT_1156480 [Lactifluus subvellereus]|nr:hypothetical protein BJV78DRAFT_1156480 [Lactifluus subvellereus]